MSAIASYILLYTETLDIVIMECPGLIIDEQIYIILLLRIYMVFVTRDFLSHEELEGFPN